MNRTRTLLATAILGVGASLFSAVPAWAQHGYDSSALGTSQRATNCACDNNGQAATQPQQPAGFAKQSNPAAVRANSGAGNATQQR